MKIKDILAPDVSTRYPNGEKVSPIIPSCLSIERMNPVVLNMNKDNATDSEDDEYHRVKNEIDKRHIGYEYNGVKKMGGIEFVKRIDSVLKDSNKTRKELAEKLNIIPATMATWKTKDIMPPVDTIQRIADELMVSIDWLVNGKEFTADNLYERGFSDGVSFCKTEINRMFESHITVSYTNMKIGNNSG